MGSDNARLGPETILAHNSRELSNHIAQCRDPMEPARLQRLLRSLHGLMVMFQPKEQQLWIDAAYSVKGWPESGRDWSYFIEGSTEHGSRHEEGEEEEDEEEEEEAEAGSDDDDDDDIDPQDRRPVPDDDAGHGGGPTSSTNPTGWDYES